MTPRAELSAAVVERCTKRLMRCKTYPGGTAAVLSEFLAIIEGRGLRVVPRAPTPAMCQSARQVDDEAPYLSLWSQMFDAAPPLAELLEDRRNGD